ncbi:hypothetical protein niasHT_032439 [Heterodera trifolii]|uniref:NADPH:adrenodoxin oxidoreductase, mitochondrial n=1 Tax=Heterodera trifolii TaxID=157864 RepID=A0ABD2HRD0_9BILA
MRTGTPQTVGHLQFTIADNRRTIAHLYLCFSSCSSAATDRPEQARNFRRVLEVRADWRASLFVGFCRLFLHGNLSALLNPNGKGGRLDPVEWKICRQIPPRFRPEKNDVYITKKTKVAAQFFRCKKLLDTKFDEVRIHALGHAIGRALSLALSLRDAMAGSVKLDVQTSTVQVSDEVQSLSDCDLADVRLRMRLPRCRIDVFDKAQAPYGLIFYGVAPDHFDMKKSMNNFERMFNDNRDRIELFCNVDIGRDFSYGELCDSYEAVVLAYGANRARRMSIPNENAANCLSGSAFVSWYNGAPLSSSEPLLDTEDAVIIGNGNVAIDCARILLSDPDVRLAGTDITEKALRALRQSRVRRVRVLGRRGPQNCSFTIKELRELLGLPGVHSHCVISEVEAAKLKNDLAQMERPKQRLLKLMLDNVPHSDHCEDGIANDGRRLLQFHFHRLPEAIQMDSSGRMRGLSVRNTHDGSTEIFPCGLLIYAIGFEHAHLPCVPTREDGKLAMSDWCRVISDRQALVYATGWCSHEARGLIADSQQQAYAVADQLADDWETGQIGGRQTVGEANERRAMTKQLLTDRKVSFINWDDWRYIDKCERRMGAILGKSREKITDVSTLLRIIP